MRGVEDLRLAKEAIEQQNARQRGEHLSRAVAIVRLYSLPWIAT